MGIFSLPTTDPKVVVKPPTTDPRLEMQIRSEGSILAPPTDYNSNRARSVMQIRNIYFADNDDPL